MKLTKIINALEYAKRKLENKLYETYDETYDSICEREEVEEEIYAIEEALYLLKEYE